MIRDYLPVVLFGLFLGLCLALSKKAGVGINVDIALRGG